MKKILEKIVDVFVEIPTPIGVGIILSLVPIIGLITGMMIKYMSGEYIILGILIGYLLVCWVHFILAILKRFNKKDEDE